MLHLDISLLLIVLIRELREVFLLDSHGNVAGQRWRNTNDVDHRDEKQNDTESDQEADVPHKHFFLVFSDLLLKALVTLLVLEDTYALDVFVLEDLCELTFFFFHEALLLGGIILCLPQQTCRGVNSCGDVQSITHPVLTIAFVGFRVSR